MGLFTVFSKKSDTNLGWLGVDIHSHILPGIDDGCPDIDISLDFVQRLHKLGLTASYATPHIFDEMYPNNAETIGAALSNLQHALQSELPEFRLSAAAEYMVDADFARRYQQTELFTLPGNHLLIEMPYAAENLEIERHLFELQVHGYIPILAHPERYAFYHGRLEQYKRLKDLGCRFQLNLLSPCGYYGSSVRKVAKWLLGKGMADFVGTDLHHAKHMVAIERFVLSGDAHAVFAKNPIINQELVDL